MDIVKPKWKRNVFFKAWERCRSLGSIYTKKPPTNTSLTRSKSWHCTSEEDNNKRRKKCRQVPEGCFAVYVGPEKQRFVIKTEFINHPLFKMLLDDAEMEYGFSSQGPILLPCEVDLFYKVLAEIDSGDEISIAPIWGSFTLCSPLINNGAYRVLSPSWMLKLNRF